MRTAITLNQNPSPAANYLTWSPAPAQILLADADEVVAPVDVRLRNQDTSQGGQVVFFTALSGTGTPELSLSLPGDGTPVDFFVAGQFGKPSTTDRDAAIEVVEAGTNTVLSITPLMVRIRKNANRLTTAERNRLRSALALLNDRGMGRFSDFRNVHTQAGDPEAHGNAGFLPWHRAYLLDLERELQNLDPSVTLPYWRFDQPAPNLFTRAFIGIPEPATGTVQFSADNPLQFWTTDGVTGIVRRPWFNTQTGQAFVVNEASTFALGGPTRRFGSFRRMEGNPHGTSHTSFGGFISQIPTAARDPLFFLLHANVDRLWAKWQWFHSRFDVTSADVYSFMGSSTSPGATRIGHNLDDSMWPWNQITGSPRPPTAPGGDFPPSSITSSPGLTPQVRAMIDYQGVVSAQGALGFDYDDVPFEF